MKTFSVRRPDKPLDKPTAWACTFTNLLVLPGLGSLVAGRRIGYLQAGLSLTGFAGGIVWLVAMVAEWLREGAFPTEVGTLFWSGMGVIGLLGGAWVWALKTSLDLHRQAASNVPPLLNEGEIGGETDRRSYQTATESASKTASSSLS